MSNTGIVIDLPIVVNNPLLETDHPDKRMTDGTVLLLDFQRSGQLEVPEHNEKITNIAWENAKYLIDPNGDTVEEDYKIRCTNTGTSNGMKLELTSKGGLHGIVSQQNDIANGNDFIIAIPTIIKNYIFNNIGKGVFVSLWTKKTRLATTPISANFILHLQNTGNFITSFQTGGSSIIGNNLGHRGDATQLNSLLPQCLNVGVSQKNGSPNLNNECGFKFGSNFAYGGFELNKSCSEIFYQLRIDIFDESKKSYAQLDAEDYAAFQEAFSTGGRFSNDTYTSPNILP